jgi:hypothetical protein
LAVALLRDTVFESATKPSLSLDIHDMPPNGPTAADGVKSTKAGISPGTQAFGPGGPSIGSASTNNSPPAATQSDRASHANTAAIAASILRGDFSWSFAQRVHRPLPIINTVSIRRRACRMCDQPLVAVMRQRRRD